MSSEHLIRYDYSDVPTIGQFSASNAFLRGLMGPFGSGKSSGCVMELIRRAQEQAPGPDGVRRTRAAVIRNTYSELRSTTIKTVLDWLPTRHFGHYVDNKHTYFVKGFKGCELEIIFLALDKPEDLKKLLSLELTFGWVNEAREVPWAIIEALQGRVNRYPSMREGGPTWTGIWMDTNPPDTESEWYNFFEEKTWLKDFNEMKDNGSIPANMQPEDYVDIFKQPSGLAKNAENLTNLKDGRTYYVKLAIGKTPEWKKVYVDGQYGFVIDGMPVYGSYYNDAVHCRDNIGPVEGVPIYRGWDFGLTPACVLSQELPSGQWLVFDEFIGKSIGIDSFSDYVLQRCARNFRGPGVRFIDHGDPAGNQRAQTDERTCFEILWAKGVRIEAGEQSPTIRLESVRKPLSSMPGGEPQFILHSRCKVLRKGFMGGYQYRRMQVSGERYTETPDKNKFSHPHDALQYTATHLFAGALTQPRHEDDFPRQDDFEMRIGASPFCGY